MALFESNDRRLDDLERLRRRLRAHQALAQLARTGEAFEIVPEVFAHLWNRARLAPLIDHHLIVVNGET